MDREQNSNFKRKPRKKVCQFCADKTNIIDYKDAAKLRKYVSERGKILPRRVTSTCAMHQRELTEAIKRARQIALLPYSADWEKKNKGVCFGMLLFLFIFIFYPYSYL